ncbi:hypothetical protein [Streptomyces sp. RPT161]|uniref:hypothetical protein n=1 Tax=Streptomyces sp. RPT161 TaxID=3015993 RepID=UPI0022B897CD|nr:hypothetical protein [Streptomyces sp. RPT161]
MHATVVAASGMDLRILLDTLKGTGVSDAWVLGNAAGDRFMFDEPRPDLIICVLDPENIERTDPSPKGFTNLDVMMRAGQSAGRGLPTLIIAPPPLHVASPVAGTVVAHCPLDQREALADHVWAFASTVRATEEPSAPEKVALERRIDPTSFLRRLEGIPRESTGGFYLGVESLVAKLFQEAGAALLKPPPQTDLAFIPSEDSSAVMLIEVKAGKLTEDQLVAAEVRLQGRVDASRAQLGVLIYYDLKGRGFPARYTTGAAVVRLRLEDLIEQLGTRSLPEVIAFAVAQRGSVAS